MAFANIFFNRSEKRVRLMHIVFTNLNKKFIADLEQQLSIQDTVRRLTFGYQCYI
jgi:hypothetical protein